MVPEDSRHHFLFPETLMTLLSDPQNIDVITFLPDGKFFAVRVQTFVEELLQPHFQMSSFEEFVETLEAWGFTAISSEEETDASPRKSRGLEEITEASIQVFRHPHFRRGGDLHGLRYSPSRSGDSHMSSVPGRTKIEFTLSDDSSTSAKRRLSPSHGDKYDSEEITRRQRTGTIDKGTFEETHDSDQRQSVQRHGFVVPTYGSPSTAATSASEPSRQVSRRRSSTDIRSKALAFAEAQLSIEDTQTKTNLVANKAQRRASLPLIDGGLDKATHTIVSDAIETLLFDERHTRETFLKHEKELSKSSLPGVIPISKQLFSSAQGEFVGKGGYPRGGAVRRTSLPPTLPSESSVALSHLTASPTKLEAAAALVRQAGMKGPPLPDHSKS
eukprot:Nitzschia sp. Nitz4//scaffold163_size50693//19936//21096//NITZ4_006988-RA/size50693-processed-gene-0.46-mRNA-1//-1//CDS//3329538031//776//frame0